MPDETHCCGGVAAPRLERGENEPRGSQEEGLGSCGEKRTRNYVRHRKEGVYTAHRRLPPPLPPSLLFWHIRPSGNDRPWMRDKILNRFPATIHDGDGDDDDSRHLTGIPSRPFFFSFLLPGQGASVVLPEEAARQTSGH